MTHNFYVFPAVHLAAVRSAIRETIKSGQSAESFYTPRELTESVVVLILDEREAERWLGTIGKAVA